MRQRSRVHRCRCARSVAAGGASRARRKCRRCRWGRGASGSEARLLTAVRSGSSWSDQGRRVAWAAAKQPRPRAEPVSAGHFGQDPWRAVFSFGAVGMRAEGGRVPCQRAGSCGLRASGQRRPSCEGPKAWRACCGFVFHRALVQISGDHAPEQAAFLIRLTPCSRVCCPTDKEGASQL